MCSNTSGPRPNTGQIVTLTTCGAIVALAIFSFAGAGPSEAFGPPSDGSWSPLSRTAFSITGPVTLGHNRLTLARKTFALTLVKEVDRAHLTPAGKIADMSEQPTSAKLFKTVLPKDARLLNGNNICGADHGATWVLAVFAEARLSLAFFSGARQPELNPAIVANGHELCGTFGYISADK